LFRVQSERAVDVQSLTLTGAGFDEPLAGRCYRPRVAGARPLVVFFHGGGFVLGDLDIYDGSCRLLAESTRCAVLAVDYRLAPEHPYPAAARDAWASLVWAASTQSLPGVDTTRIALVGDSAGGNLTAVTSLRSRDVAGPRVITQVLVYPVVDHYRSARESYTLFATDCGLTRASLTWFWDQYLPHPGPIIPDYAAPRRATSHEGLPPTLVVTAEYDVLRDEAEAYARALADAGVEAQVLRCLGMNHGFLAFAGLLEEADQTLETIASWLRTRLQV
jgi:acetyl esterase